MSFLLNHWSEVNYPLGNTCWAYLTPNWSGAQFPSKAIKTISWPTFRLCLQCNFSSAQLSVSPSLSHASRFTPIQKIIPQWACHLIFTDYPSYQNKSTPLKRLPPSNFYELVYPKFHAHNLQQPSPSCAPTNLLIHKSVLAKWREEVSRREVFKRNDKVQLHCKNWEASKAISLWTFQKQFFLFLFSFWVTHHINQKLFWEFYSIMRFNH